MAQENKLSAQARTVQGSSAARRLRRAGFVPAVLATLDGQTELLQLEARPFQREMSRHKSSQIVVTLDDGAKSRLALIREIQRDGITGAITHADFGEVDPAKKLRMHVRLLLLGEPVGVRAENGVLEQPLRSVEVSCLPSDAVEDFEIDVSDLHVGQDIKVADLKLDASKFTLHADPHQAVATVVSAIADEPAPAAAPAAADAAAPAAGAAPAAPAADAKKAPAKK
ncbi:MAG: 50S ribosomal protein L25 [Kiritimatiellae bacterium]|nr:50S ribosomal protein L25 [Kiritimatiellia bacterium]